MVSRRSDAGDRPTGGEETTDPEQADAPSAPASGVAANSADAGDAASADAARDAASAEQLRAIARLAGSASRDAPDAQPPTRWGSLTLREKIGDGVFGEVFRAHDISLQRDVAVKLLRTGSLSADAMADRLMLEGRLLARLSHPNVVRVFGVERHEGRVGLWMELIRGLTLEQLLRVRGPFSAVEAALVGQDVCAALAAVHGAGLVHRDLKPQNVMREEGGRIVLMDFGAGQPRRPGDRAVVLAGTPLYTAPEVLHGAESTTRSDIYSAGVLLFQLVTGSHPVRGATLADVRGAHRRGDVVKIGDVRPELPPAFVSAIDQALAPTPDRRHASAGAFRAALAEVLRSSPHAAKRQEAHAQPSSATDVATRLRAWVKGLFGR